MQIEIEQLPRMRVGAVRHVGPFNQIGKSFQQLGAIAGQAGLFQAPGALMMGIFHDDPRETLAEKLRSDAAIAVSDGTRLPEGLTEQVVPGGRYARYTHIGDYEGLPGAWTQFTALLGAGAYRMREAPGLEVYRNNPMNTPKEELRTDLYMPVE
jgi:AraC family transcriptional regulator